MRAAVISGEHSLYSVRTIAGRMVRMMLSCIPNGLGPISASLHAIGSSAGRTRGAHRTGLVIDLFPRHDRPLRADAPDFVLKVILAGGLDTRLHGEPYLRSRPMIEIDERPILSRIKRIGMVGRLHGGRGKNFVIRVGYTPLRPEPENCSAR
jgi:hypothetical protein